MSRTYLNGRITVSSLAAPTDGDLKAIAALSDDERRALIAEAIQLGVDSGIGEMSAEDIWKAAKAQAALVKTTDHVG